MSKIALVGEAWGEKEEDEGRPFVGPSGYLLDQMLSQAGIRRADCFVTNVFNLRPKPSNDVKNLCGGAKEERVPGMPALMKGKFVRARYAAELSRLYSEISEAGPNVVVALGATAAWALLHTQGIKNIRGAVAEAHPAVGQKLKVLPTYHPAAVARDYSLRPTVVADFDKACRESAFPEIRRPRREIWIEPTLADLQTFEDRYIGSAPYLSADIETAGNQITCIGFATSRDRCIVIPFHSTAQRDGNYWRTRLEELTAWAYIRRWLTRPTVFQNGMYDIQFLWRSYGIPVPNALEDTMLLHHAYQPEMEKGLGYLGSIYTDEISWKHMRKGAHHD